MWPPIEIPGMKNVNARLRTMIHERAAAEDVHVLTLEHESGAENPEDRARGADGEALRREEERAGRSGQARDDVEQQIAAAAEHLLDGGAEPPEREHVQPEVDRPVVEEHRGEEPPVVPVRDERAVEDALPVDLVAGAVDLRRRRRARAGRRRR